MTNPWTQIELASYIRHMSGTGVLQFQMLNQIFSEQYRQYLPTRLMVLGITEGNGLEHVQQSVTSDVYGVDVNGAYLDECQKHYGQTVNHLHLSELDLNQDIITGVTVDLILANLVLEYIDLLRFFQQILAVSHPNTVVSVVIQQNNGNHFVSDSQERGLNVLESFHHAVSPESFIHTLNQRGYRVLLERQYDLPHNKQFIRVDFKAVNGE